ncbi:hypothetical protein [Seongchinamella unica]|uniref:hypothetical protein n=1 Tax=Seongchinamella unica TaxID=2547392 RepID=UPI001EEF3F05|nr:hypothetical protein [Seongchinamella unica]
MIFLSPLDVVEIHEFVIEGHELQGIARDKSIEAIIGRIDNRIAFGMIRDVFELAACYACYLSVGHAFRRQQAHSIRGYGRVPLLEWHIARLRRG